jgi:hypothetical protein
LRYLLSQLLTKPGLIGGDLGLPRRIIWRGRHRLLPRRIANQGIEDRPWHAKRIGQSL